MGSRWFNGRIAGASTIASCLIALLVLFVPDLRAGLTRQWNDGWPQAQVASIIFLLSLGGVSTRAKRIGRALRRNLEAVESRGSEMQTDLDRLRAACGELDADALKADRRLFEELVAVIPSTNPALEFLRSHDFGATFELDQLNGLVTYEHDGWDHPERAFHDETLGIASEQFLDAVKSFLLMVAQYTSPVGNMHRQGVAEPHILDTLQIDDGDANRRLVCEIEELNHGADAVIARHGALIRQGRQRLRL